MVSVINILSSTMDGNKFDDSLLLAEETISSRRKADLSPPVIRSVAMSANIASTVQDEVKHLIKVNHVTALPVARLEVSQASTEPNDDNSDFSDTYSADHDYPSVDMHNVSICSHVLPIEDSVVSALVLSRWDDIMGPRTIRVWLPENQPGSEGSLDVEPITYTTPRSVKAACQFSCMHHMSTKYNKNLLMKAIKYVTSHTVNYTCVTGTSTPEESSSAIFVVPDLDMVAQSLMFHVPLSGSSPYSLALLVRYSHYSNFLPLRRLCLHWLERLTVRLADFLLSVSDVDGMEGVEIPPSTMVDSWMVELCSMLTSLQVNGLGELNALQSYLSPTTLGNPVLERAVTSHLQTLGCTIVMGNISSEINFMIAFLALFLDEEARCCSRLVHSGQKYTFQIGLYVQGLLLDEFGCRDLSSEELQDNPLPITWVDLSKSSGVATSVRQGLPLHQHQSKAPPTESTMRIFKGESSLVRTLLHDLRQLPPRQWSGVVEIFMLQIQKLALSLLSVVHWNGVPSAPEGSKTAVDNPTVRHLRANLNIDDATFFIVLAHADRLRPGAYRLVMEGSLD